MQGLVERPETEENHDEAADGEDVFVGGFGVQVADVDVVDEVGGGGEEPVVGGGDDLGEDGSHEECAEELERAGAGEAVKSQIGKDFAGALVDFAGGKEDGADDSDGDDDGLEDDCADDPANNGAGGGLLGLGGEELLVHGLVAEEEEAGGEEDLHALDGGEVAKYLKVRGGKGGVDGGPASGTVGEDGQGDEQGEGGKKSNGYIHIGYGGHAGYRGEDDDEGGDDVFAEVGCDEVGEDEVEDVAAADELVAGYRGAGKEDSDDSEDAGGLVVAGFEEVGDGELGELAGSGGDEEDEEDADPAAASLPEGCEAVLVGVLRATEEGT